MIDLSLHLSYLILHCPFFFFFFNPLVKITRIVFPGCISEDRSLGVVEEGKGTEWGFDSRLGPV